MFNVLANQTVNFCKFKLTAYSFVLTYLQIVFQRIYINTATTVHKGRRWLRHKHNEIFTYAQIELFKHQHIMILFYIIFTQRSRKVHYSVLRL